MTKPLTILFLDNDQEAIEKVKQFLLDQSIPIVSTIANNIIEYSIALDNTDFDIILSDHLLPNLNAEEALRIRNNKKILSPFILLSENISQELALALTKNGASDYIFKDRLIRLSIAIIHGINRRRIMEEKLLVEAELLKSNERFELAAKATSEAIWDWDLQLNKMVYGNGFETLFGYKPDEWKGSPVFWLKFVHPDDKDRVTNSLEDFINKSELGGWNETYRYIRSDGSFATVINKGIVLRENNIPFRMVGAIQDITELSEKNNELKQFSYIVSHNLNAPLSNLIGILNIVNYETLDEHNLSLVKMFGETTRQLKQIIEHLSYTLIIKNSVAELQEVDLNQIFERSKQILNNEINLINPKFFTEFEIETIKTKGTYIESVFLNLLSNAIKYRAQNRPLVISISSKPFMNGRTQIIFSDNGSGIDMERNKGKIFGLYQRFHSEGEGQGMGLYLIKIQIAALGGTIEVMSEVDKGTTFFIVI